MNTKQIEKILTLHSIPYYINNGEIIADSMEGETKLFEVTINLTGISKKELFSWLGY